ncbi:MAG: hypothetical protein CR986_08715 [Ignavibacteriae bacterium]|nr:MAG: hypothetical protein CR986_08715 [Ignavibacteriota bacterium]
MNYCLTNITTNFLNNLETKHVILYADFNVINYLYENKIEIPKGIQLYPDSTAVYFYLKYFLKNNCHKIVSTDLQYKMLEHLNKNSNSLFLFGDSDEILEKTKSNIAKNYPNVNIVGMKNGYQFDHQKIIKDINNFEPDILLVGLGVGRQEKWILDNYKEINCNLILAVGGWFQYLSGGKKRAPLFLRSLHLEWLYKLCHEFFRVWERYFIGIPKFFYRVFTKKIIIELKD